MKILIVVDKPNSAIDRLAQMVKKYSREEIEIIPIHPKRESEEQINRFKVLADQADIIDFEYWKSATLLLDRFPELKIKPTILTHHNPYNVLEIDWNPYKFDMIVAKNKHQYKDLEKAGYKNIAYIKHAIDFDYYNFGEFKETTSVNMVAARIEGKKGVKEVAEVCADLGYKFNLVGSVSKPEYFDEILQAGRGNVYYHPNISNELLETLYHNSAVHICNSVDNFESGTLPILEAMACGCPVLTRNVGLVPDIFNGENMIVRYGQPEDKEELKSELKKLVENEKLRKDNGRATGSRVNL